MIKNPLFFYICKNSVHSYIFKEEKHVKNHQSSSLLSDSITPLILFSPITCIKTIDISSAGNGKECFWVILPEMAAEIIIMQPDRMDDDRYIGHEVNCLTAFTRWNRLWQIGNPANGASAGPIFRRCMISMVMALMRCWHV